MRFWFFFFHFHFQQTKFSWCYCYFLINSTEQDLMEAHNVGRICQKSGKGDEGIMAFPNVGIVPEQKKFQEKVYWVTLL